MATIGDIVVNLDVNRKGFTSGIDAAQSKLGKFGSMAKTGLGMAGKAVAVGMATAAAGTAAAVAVIVPNVNKAMDRIDELAKTSDKLGIATENLAGLRHAAELTGAGTATLDKGLEKMVQTISRAAQGVGPGVDALEELGLSADVLNQMSPDEQFKAIADSIAGVQNPADQLRLTMELFGRSGGGLVNTLKGGSAAVQGMVDEADKLGLAVNRVDAAKIEAANDAYTRMWSMFDGIWNTLAVALAPILEHVISKFVDWGTEGNTAAEWINWGIEMIARGIGFAGDLIDGLSAYWQAMQAAATKALAWVLSGVNKLAEGISYLGGLIGMDFDTSFLKGMADEMHRMADADIAQAREKFQGALNGNFSAKVMAELDAINQAADDAATKVANNAADKINVVDQNLLDQLDAAKEKTKQLEQAAKSIFDATRTPMEKFEQEVAQLQELFSGGFIDEETFGRKLDSLKEGIFDTIEVDEVKVANADLTQNAALQRGSQEAFSRMISAIQGPGKDSAQIKSLKEQQEQKRLLTEMVSIMRKNNTRGVRLLAANLGG